MTVFNVNVTREYGVWVAVIGALLLLTVFAALPSLIANRAPRPVRDKESQAAPAPAVPSGTYRELYTATGEKVLVLTPQTNRLAITSFVLALVFGIILAGLPSIITGHIALRQIRQNNQSGKGLATAGLVLGYIALAVDLLIVVAVVIALLA